MVERFKKIDWTFLIPLAFIALLIGMTILHKVLQTSARVPVT